MLGSCYIPDKWPANSRVPQLLRNIWPIFTCGCRLKPREILWLQLFPPGNGEALSGMQMKTFPWGLFLFPSWNLRFGHIQGPTWQGGVVHTAPEVSILNVFLSLGKKRSVFIYGIWGPGDCLSERKQRGDENGFLISSQTLSLSIKEPPFSEHVHLRH